MPILYDERCKAFRLDTPSTSYCMQVDEFGHLLHTYYGASLDVMDLRESLRGELFQLSAYPAEDASRTCCMDILPCEFSGGGCGDFRPAAAVVRNGAGNAVTEFLYTDYRIVKGKPGLEGLPASHADDAPEDAETLEVTLTDSATGMQAILLYSVFLDSDVIARSVRIVNRSAGPVSVLRAMSLCLDFPRGDYTFTHFPGHWAGERKMESDAVPHGSIRVESLRGTSSHQQSPQAILSAKGCSEDEGECYGVCLVYSGSFLMEASVNQADSLRLLAGVHPDGFAWKLEPGEAFQAPEALLCYSAAGLNALSQRFAVMMRRHICRGVWKDRIRPVVYNSWEGAYFDYDMAKLRKIAREAASLGVELFVLDDGWFGKRDDDTSSLGDWMVHSKKFPDGLGALGDEVRRLGMGFGLWIEPEMVNENSELFRAHPDWCLTAPGRRGSVTRNQRVLDMTRSEVRDYVFDSISQVLSQAKVAYVKWDMNRSLTEAASRALSPDRQQEALHRYVLGVYSLMERMTSAFPDILWEGCAGGGGRFDAGMLYYMPQYWTSDNTDALDRLDIQRGSSYFFPASAISAHVSACPNHQTGRVVPLETRACVAMYGAFGYELDALALSEPEKEAIREQIQRYHGYARLIADGRYYRLTPSNPKYEAWAFVSESQEECLFSCVKRVGAPIPEYPVILLRGLKKDACYRCAQTNAVYSGAYLEQVGLRLLQLKRDADSCQLYFQRVPAPAGEPKA